MNMIARKKKWILLCAVCLAAVGAAVFFIVQRQGRSMKLDDNAVMGVLPGIDMEQRQSELQQQLDEGMIAFSINASPVFETGGAEGNLMLENPAQNAKLLLVEIYADATSELLYRSELLPAGSYIENDRLDKVLEPGRYPATAYFHAYREDDQSYIGQAGAAISLTICS